MIQTATTTEEYIQMAPKERQEALTRIRHLCRSTLPQAEETIIDGKPVYVLEGTNVAAFASQAQHIAFYAYEPDVRQTHSEEFTALQESMIQFNKAHDVDYELIQKLLHETAELYR